MLTKVIRTNSSNGVTLIAETDAMKYLFFLILIYSYITAFSSSLWAGEIVIKGCDITKKAFLGQLVKVYEDKTGTKIRLTGGGATKGIRAVAAGTADIGSSCRHLLSINNDIHTEEKNVELIRIGWDAIVVITNPANPVNNITLGDLKSVYEGRLKYWDKLGWSKSRIALVTREGTTSGVGYMFRILAWGDPDFQYKARSLKVKSSKFLEYKIEKIPNSIGIDGVSSAKKRNVKIVSLDNIAPTKENIALGRYPLFRPLYLSVASSGASEEVRAFVKFVLSTDGQRIISEQGSVNLKEGAGLVSLWNRKENK